MSDTFTREQVLEMLSIRPCHVTGMHEPEHHLKYTCPLQKAEAFDRALTVLGAAIEDMPKHLHDACYWCHGDPPPVDAAGEPTRSLGSPSQERYRQRSRETHTWAGVPVPAWLRKKGTDT